jgi:hypothetical protein
VTPEQRERIIQLLEELDAEAGPIPDDVLNAARQIWRR